MNREEVAMIGFEIVAYSGEARSKYLEALKIHKNEGSIEEIKTLIKKADECIAQAHKTQTKLLAMEADGDEVELGFIFVHGQDHLMTTILLKDILDNLMDIYN